MIVHTTNYFDTFIEVAEDCPITTAELPPVKGEIKSAANIQFELINKNPYKFTSDDVLFEVYAIQKDLTKSELKSAREQFFSKGQPCFRSSPLTKRYGWGVHSDSKGRIAIYALGSAEYKKYLKDGAVKHLKGMRSKRK